MAEIIPNLNTSLHLDKFNIPSADEKTQKKRAHGRQRAGNGANRIREKSAEGKTARREAESGRAGYRGAPKFMGKRSAALRGLTGSPSRSGASSPVVVVVVVLSF